MQHHSLSDSPFSSSPLSGQPLSNPQPLSPELEIIHQLSPLWAQRFTQLACFIWEHLDQPLPVTELAERVELSSYYFHRMFKAAFGEPVGSYIRRARLILAADHLLETDRPVIDIALDCGFSSPQALAKALKKQTGLTASEIRAARNQPGLTTITAIHAHLGQPTQSEQNPTQEQTIAAQLSFVRHTCPDRHFQCVRVKQATITDSYERWHAMASDSQQEMISLTLGNPHTDTLNDLKVWVGYAVEPDSANYMLTGGEFLSVRVSLTSTLGYYAAWEALIMYLVSEGLQPANDTPALEITHNPHNFEGPVDITLSVKLMPG